MTGIRWLAKDSLQGSQSERLGYQSVLAVFLILLLFLSGCVASGRDTVFASQPLVSGKVKDQTYDEKPELPRSVAVLPFANKTDKEAAFEVVRRTVSNNMAGKNYRSLHPADIDRRLRAQQYPEPFQLDPEHDLAALCRLFGVEGLLFGEISHYNIYFVGVYAQVAVGVGLQLYSCDGSRIWSGEKVVRTHAGGISTTPVGLIISAVSAVMHASEVNLYRAADELGRTLVASIPEPEWVGPARPPRIIQLVHSGAGRVMRYGDVLDVAMEAEPGLFASVRIEGLGVFDLVENQPGFYELSLPVAPDVNLRDAGVVGMLEGKDGGRSEWLSPLGLVNIDNTPPQPVRDLSLAASDGELRLDWRAPVDDDLKKYRVLVAEVEQGPYRELAVVYDPYYVDKSDNFLLRYYRVLAEDIAGNQGEPAQVSGFAVPDKRFAAASPLRGSLPASIDGKVLLDSRGGPYHLHGQVKVEDGALLFVGPGTVLRFAPDAMLLVEGELHVYGGAGEARVIVEGQAGRSFNTAIRLVGNNPVSIRGVDFRGGAIPLQIHGGRPLVSNCLFDKGNYSAIEIRGTVRPVLENNIIRNSNAGAVIISGLAQVRLRGNSFENNHPLHLQSSSPYLIDASGNSWQPPASADTVLGDVRY